MSYGLILLIIISLVSSALTAVLYYKNKKQWKLYERSEKGEQIIFGVIFGVLAILGTELGIHYNGAVLNIRDAAPLCAALYFGPEAGVIAGLMGGIERWFAVYWGIGSFTRLACTVGTIFAGLFGAFLKKYVFENRIPGVIYAFLIGGITEVFHMLMVYLFRGNEALQAHDVITACAPCMIPLVALTVAVPAYIIFTVEGDSPFFTKKNKRKIAQNIAFGLAISVSVAFLLSNAFEITLQNRLAVANTDKMLTQSLTDVTLKINAKKNENTDIEEKLSDILSYRHVGTSGTIFAINKDGKIVANKPKNISTSDVTKIIENYNYADEYELVKTSDAKLGTKEDFYYSYIQYKDYGIVAVYPATDADLIKNTSNTLTTLLELIILGVVFIMIYILVRVVVVKDINTINDALSAISSGNLDSVVDVNSSEEFSSLSSDINTTVKTLKKYIADAELRVAEELQMAKNIQHAALPSDFPNDERFEIYANMLAAKDVGGDFYDFYPVGNDKYAILIADVSGKGIPAAMFMMSAKTIIKNIVESGASPAVAFTKANEKLCEDNAEEMFVTAWLGIIDLNTGKMKYVNAGHNYPVIIKADGSTCFLESLTDFVLAGMDGIKYQDYEVDIEKGTTLYLYTDGVTEATNLENKLFGEDRMIKAISKSNISNPKDICRTVKDDVDEFVGKADRFDDITMLAFRRSIDEDDFDGIETNAEKESIEKVVEFLEDFIERNDIPKKKATKILIIADEIYSNIAYYSNANKAIVSAKIENDKIYIVFKDNGIKYNPLEKEDPKVDIPIAERKIGGLGVYVVKKTAESVQYEYQSGMNVLTVVL